MIGRALPRALGLALCLGAGACRHPGARGALVPETEAPDAPAVAAPPAGALVDGVWTDHRFPWTLRVPPGWEVVPGTESANPRLTLVHGETRARVEVSVVPDGPIGPRRRRGCTCDFTDLAGYRALSVPGPVQVGTCTPEDARHARVLGYYVLRDGVAYDIEEVLPPGRLVDGKAAADACVGAFRMR